MKRFWLFVFLFIVACNRSAQPAASVAQVGEVMVVSTQTTVLVSRPLTHNQIILRGCLKNSL